MFISKFRVNTSNEHQPQMEGICGSTQWLVFYLLLLSNLFGVFGAYHSNEAGNTELAFGQIW